VGDYQSIYLTKIDKRKPWELYFKKIIFTLGENNYFEVGILKRVFFETILLHISNYKLQIHLVYDECINYGYYLMRFYIALLLLFIPIYDLDKPHLLLLNTLETHIHVLSL